MALRRTWRCEVCGYVHEGPEPPGTCPICGVGAELFSPLPESPAFEGAEPPAAVQRWRCRICDLHTEGASPPAHCPLCGAGESSFEPATGLPLPTPAPSRAALRLLVLGAGVAGLTAARRARSLDPQARITLLSREAHLPYYRLNLTRVLAGEVDESSLPMISVEELAAQRIDFVHGDAVEIDRPGQQVVLRDGRRLPYDRLIVACGAHAFVPPVPGVARQGLWVLRSLEDVRGILAALRPGMRCLCVGGGLLGLEAAGALAQRGAEVTVLEGFGWLLPRQLAEPAGRLLQQAVEARGIRVRNDVRVEEVLGDESVAGVRLASGEVLPAELVLLATGVRPNSYLARQAGLDVGLGLRVDDRMASSDPLIFAAGDVAEHAGTVSGIWPVAFAQAEVAAAAALGQRARYRAAPPSNRLKVLGVDLLSVGQFRAEDASFRVFERSEAGSSLRLVLRDGRLVGANLFGDSSLAALVVPAIEDGVQVLQAESLLAAVPGLAEFIERAAQT